MADIDKVRLVTNKVNMTDSGIYTVKELTKEEAITWVQKHKPYNDTLNCGSHLFSNRAKSVIKYSPLFKQWDEVLLVNRLLKSNTYIYKLIIVKRDKKEISKPKIRTKTPQYLSVLRKQLKMTQIQLGEAIGVSSGTISNLENGHNKDHFLNSGILDKLADYFNMSKKKILIKWK